MITTTVIIAGVVMVIAFIGMLFCAKLQRSQPNIKYIAIFLLFVVIGCGIYIMTETMGSGDTDRLIQNELKYAKATAVVLGQYLGDQFSGSKALVITSENYEKNKRQKELVDGLKEGMGARVIIEAIGSPIVEKKEGVPPEEMMMMEEMLQAKNYNELIEKHKDCELVISIIGLPHDIKKMKIWKNDNKQKLALLFGDVFILEKAIQIGKVVAAVTYRPGVKFTEEAAPSDPKEAFEKRYLLITPENVKEIAEKFPNIFANEKNR